MVSRFTTSWLYMGEQVEGSRLNATSVSAFCHMVATKSELTALSLGGQIMSIKEMMMGHDPEEPDRR